MSKKSNGIQTMPCPRCDGSGQVEMNQELAEVFTFVKSHPRCTAPQLKKALDRAGVFHVTAFNQRLETLRGYGVVTRERIKEKGVGFAWLYSATNR